MFLHFVWMRTTIFFSALAKIKYLELMIGRTVNYPTQLHLCLFTISRNLWATSKNGMMSPQMWIYLEIWKMFCIILLATLDLRYVSQTLNLKNATFIPCTNLHNKRLLGLA